VALAAVAAIVIYAEFSPSATALPHWVWLLIITAIMFGYLCRAFRRLWRSPKFWIVYVALLFLHVVAWRVLLQRWDSGFLVAATLISGVEFVFLCIVTDQIANTQ
jgi:cell division protein FtsW (lipid II flippase)